MARRQERVNDLLREVVAEIIARELKDPRLQADLISVTEVTTSADLQHARVLVSVLGSESQRDAVVTALNHSRNFVQRQLRPHLSMKSIPQLQFQRDDRIEEDRRILDLLDRIRRDGMPGREPDPETTAPADAGPGDTGPDDTGPPTVAARRRAGGGVSDPESLAPAPATGLFLVDKPAGPTSHDVVQQLRRWTGIRRVGHGGTLDPMATGLLPIFVGRGTRLIEYLGEHRKHYRATIRLGVRTDTDDAEGAVVSEAPVPPLSAEQIEQALSAFRGAVSQVPPAFSAVKVGGVTAHRAARRGEPVELAAREVTVHALTVEDWQSPLLQVALTVSTGTYVRAIARDLGEQLGCGGHVIEMRRTGIGPVSVEQAHSPDEIEAAFAAGNGWDLAAPLVRFFEHWPRVIPSAAQRGKLLNGQAVPLPVVGTAAGRATHALAVDRAGRADRGAHPGSRLARALATHQGPNRPRLAAQALSPGRRTRRRAAGRRAAPRHPPALAASTPCWPAAALPRPARAPRRRR